MTRMTYGDKVPIPPRFRRGTLADYFLDGFEFGEEMGKTIGRGRLRRMTRRDLTVSVDRRIDAYDRHRDSVYRSGASDRQLDAWEAGVYRGAERQRRVAAS